MTQSHLINKGLSIRNRNRHELHYAKDKDQVRWESVLSCRTFHLELSPSTYLFCHQQALF